MNKSTQDLLLKGAKLAFDLGSNYLAKRQNKMAAPAKTRPDTAALSAFGLAALNWAGEFLGKQRGNVSARVAQAGQTAKDAVQQKISELPRRALPEKVEPQKTRHSDPFGSFLMGSLIGAAIGAGAALLYAPQNGRVIRRYARKTARNWQNQVSAFAKDTLQPGDREDYP
jgi:gas vesicle protein